MEEGIKSLLSKSADDIKLGGVADTQECCAVIQKDLGKLERWAEMKVNSKRRVLHLGRNSPMHQYRPGAHLPESSSTERDVGVLAGKLSMSHQQCAHLAKESNGVLGGIGKSTASRTREDPPSLFSPREAHLEYSVQFSTRETLSSRSKASKRLLE